MSTLIFDTETTGLVRDKLPHDHPSQPMPVQLGMKLDADNRKERAALNFLIQTEGWEVGKKAAEITGIDNNIADTFGVHLISAVEMFLDTIENADTVVAHNARFDITVMRNACAVYAKMTGQKYRDPFEGKTMICTMLACIDIVQAPPKRNGQWKWPKLEECMKYFFNESIEGAHDALVDVRATGKVYYHLIDLGVFAGEYNYG